MQLGSVVSAAAVWLSMAGAAGAAPAPIVEPDPAPPVLRLAVFDAQGLLPAPVAALGAELARLFSAWGIRVETRSAVAGETVSLPPEVKVVVHPGPPRSRKGADILGEVIPQDDPWTLWVRVGAVGRVLGHAPDRPLAPEEAAQAAFALAKVVAHELGHLAAPDLPHAGEGLMGASLGREELLASADMIGARCAFRERFTRWVDNPPLA